MRAIVLLMATAALLTACASGFWSSRRQPEIWLLMGQSNMSGRGDLADLPAALTMPDPRIRVWGNDGVLRPATEPVDDADGQIDAVSADAIAAVGPGLAFARARLAFDGDRRILLVPCAKGGSSIEQWRAAPERSTLFGSCLARARQAQVHGRLAGALWYQGESDARTVDLARQWTGRFEQMLTAFRAALDRPDLPFMVVSLADPPVSGELAGRYLHWQTVRWGQNALRLPDTWVLSAAGLPRMADGLHLSTAGQLELGRRLAELSEMIHVDNYAHHPD